MRELFVAISDIHFKLATLAVAAHTLTQAFMLADEKKVPLLINGDLNDTKAILRSEVVRTILDIITQYRKVTTIVNIGNHDLDNKNSDNNSLSFLKLLPNVVVIEKPSVCNVQGHDLGVIPYQKTTAEFIDAVKTFEGHTDIIAVHQGFMSAFMGDYIVDESSANPTVVENFKLVVAGHYHKAQRLSNIQYLGSPYTVNFGEAGEEKYIWSVSVNDGGEYSMTPFLTNVRRHEVLVLENKIPRKMPTYPDNTILKVILRGDKKFCTKTKRSTIEKKLPVSNLVIATDITSDHKIRMNISDQQTPWQVIEQYMAQYQPDCDPEYLTVLKDVAADVFEDQVASNRREFRISSVKCKNFLSFQDLEFEYEHNGLTLVSGWDVDREIFTGAGKSTFMDAPYYAMFGKTSKNLKADEVVNRSAKKDCYVELTLASNEGNYTIKRYRKHNQYKNDLVLIAPDGNEIRGKDNSETQKMIEEIIGLTPEVFLNATYFTQFNLIDKFLSASDTEKKKLIAEISNTQVYDDIEQVVKERFKEIKEELDAKSQKLSLSRKTEETLIGMLNAMRQDKLDWDAEYVQKRANWEEKRVRFEAEKIAKIKELKERSEAFESDRRDKIASLMQEREEEKETIQIAEKKRQAEVENLLQQKEQHYKQLQALEQEILLITLM